MPTPGSPIRTGLFFVRRDSTWIVRRISSSRPITGSSLPGLGERGEVTAVLLERLIAGLGILRRHALPATYLLERREQSIARNELEAEEEVLDGDVVVTKRLCFFERVERTRAGPSLPEAARCRL